jgi:hypothetical protein
VLHLFARALLQPAQLADAGEDFLEAAKRRQSLFPKVKPKKEKR